MAQAYAGNMGMAIVSGILSSVRSGARPPHHSLEGINICVTNEVSVRRVQKELAKLGDTEIPVTVSCSVNYEQTFEATIVLLACKPHHLRQVLGEPGMREALAKKTLVSILAGVTRKHISDILELCPIRQDTFALPVSCQVIRAMPNTAALVRESMTVLSNWSEDSMVRWMFEQIGNVQDVEDHQLDVCTALCGSGPATFALVLEAMADGAVAMGLPRQFAQPMAAQTMRGTSGLVLNGEHPALLRDRVSTPGGCTIGGLLVLEEAAVRGAIARSVREATGVASLLGAGGHGVNGTRPQPSFLPDHS